MTRRSTTPPPLDPSLALGGDAADASGLALDPRSYEERQRDAARDQEAAAPSTVTASGLPLLTWGDGGWEAHDVLQLWAGFQSRGGPYGARDSKRAAGHVMVSIATPYDRYAPPAGCQLAAYRWLKAHEPQVVAAVLDAAFRSYPGGRAEWLSHYPDEASDLPVITSPGGLTAVMGLHAIHVLATARDGVAYVGFEFGCNWDNEHGFGVLTHLDRVIEHGSARVAFERSEAVVADGGVDLEEPTFTVRKP